MIGAALEDEPPPAVRPDPFGQAQGGTQGGERAALLDVQFDEGADAVQQVVAGTEPGRVGALKPAAARVAAIRSRSASSKRTRGVNDSWRTLSATPCSSQKLSEAERIVVTVSSTVASSAALASSQA